MWRTECSRELHRSISAWSTAEAYRSAIVRTSELVEHCGAGEKKVNCEIKLLVVLSSPASSWHRVRRRQHHQRSTCRRSYTVSTERMHRYRGHIR